MKKINRLFVALLATSINLAYANQSGEMQLNSSEETKPMLNEEAKVGDIIQQDIMEDKGLLSFIQEIKSSVKNHNWSAFIGFCSPSHYKAQVGDTRMSTTQYIAEAMGLHNEGNSIFEAGESKVDMKVLEKIKDIKILSIKKHYNEVTLKGIIILKSGAKLNISIDVLYDQNDGYMIGGALG